jgi:hypothetical protein
MSTVKRSKAYIFKARGEGAHGHDPIHIVRCVRDVSAGVVPVWYHWMEVDGQKGPETSVRYPLTYEIHGRRFVAHEFTKLLPEVFELLPADNMRLELNEVCG